jgi:hypothetical protein
MGSAKSICGIGVPRLAPVTTADSLQGSDSDKAVNPSPVRAKIGRQYAACRFAPLQRPSFDEIAARGGVSPGGFLCPR